MEKLTAVIITKNEEKNIGRCLESLTNVVDEIIVVDSFSVDQTRSICEPYAVRFIEQEWLGYSETKNLGNQLASNDWILSLDADEELSHELIKSILEEKKRGFPAKAYLLNRCTNYCGRFIRHGRWYPDWKLRIWNRQLGKWEGSIHETVQIKGNIPLKRLSGDILHYSFYRIEEHIAQNNKFSTLAAKELVQRKKHIPLYKTLLNPAWSFFRDYFFRLGFLDGYYGFVVSVLSAEMVFIKYVKARHLLRSRKEGKKRSKTLKPLKL